MKPEKVPLSREHYKCKALSIFVLLLLVLHYFNGMLLAQLPSNLLTEIGVIAEQKSKTRGFAELFKESYKQGETSKKSYIRGRMLYIEAKAAFDGWIVKLQSSLTLGQQIDSKEFHSSLRTAVEKNEKFIAYVKSSLTGRRHLGPSLVIISDLIQAITDASIKIWQEYRRATEQKKEEIIKTIGKLRLDKWDSF